MGPELLIFVGYSQDAKEEAQAIYELKPVLQNALRHLNQVASTRSTYSSLDVFIWEAGADVSIGGQASAITPHLERAAIAVFVFKERVGRVTWEELNNCRNRLPEKRIPTLAFFPDAPPPATRLTNLEVARSWANLLEKRNELTEDWTDQDSRSVTPLEPYHDTNHLKEILKKRVEDLLPSLIVENGQTSSMLEGPTHPVSDPISSNFLDSLTESAQFDPQAVQHYRSMMRSNARLAFPADLADVEFLSREGYLSSGRLTIAGALLFTYYPFKVIPCALIRCSKYDGNNKASSRDWRNCDGPLLNQIIEARDFIANNINRRERPVVDSMKSGASYEYPMVCVREILANAVCHRNYEDNKRLVYVAIYDDRIEIKSPGDWCGSAMPEAKPIPLMKLIGESVQRNMRLAHAISSVGMMEAAGSGIPTAVSDCANCGAPMPSVEQKDGYVIVTIYPSENWETDIEESFTEHADTLREHEIDLQLGSAKIQTPGTERQEKETRSEFVGQSEALSYVLFKIEQVAPTDATVLITGETGTGKELVARAIHHSSTRRGRPLIKVNCAALSESLIDSELFGHEKGAFTGAAGRKIGRFELADGATLFLDEIGELPLELQTKLLRILQEGAFERLGSTKTIKVDTRIIAATSRDLRHEVNAGAFREDLWYRLNVFGIHVPPLRQRREDIPLLAKHFARKFSAKLGETVNTISPEALETLLNHSWPGNVRELANTIERAVIVNKGSELQLTESFEKYQPKVARTLEEIERDYITRVLIDTAWQIEGPKGAARILGLNPSTLRTRIAKLGITRAKRKHALKNRDD